MHLLTSETAIRVCKLPSCPFVYKQLLQPMRFLCIADWTTRANHHVQSMAGNIQPAHCFLWKKIYAFFLETGMSNNLKLTHSKHTDW